MTTVAAEEARFVAFCTLVTDQAELDTLRFSHMRKMFLALVNIEALAKRKLRAGDPDAEHFLRFVADAGLKPLTSGQEVLR